MEAEALAERLARLEKELAEECELNLTGQALEELAYARYIAPHEGRRPSYGAVVAPPSMATRAGTALPPPPSPAAFVDNRVPLDVARRFADGRRAFVGRGVDGSHALIVDAAWDGTERALTPYIFDTGCIIIQRLAMGRTRLFYERQIYNYDDGLWLIRPTAASLFEAVSGCVGVDQHDVARALLDLCVHSLSPAGAGATLVWFPNGLRDDLMDEVAGLDLSAAFAPPALSALQSDHWPSIVHGLSQLDRAVIVDSRGDIVQLNVTLRDDPATSTLQFAGGTRHNSAG